MQPPAPGHNPTCTGGRVMPSQSTPASGSRQPEQAYTFTPEIEQVIRDRFSVSGRIVPLPSVRGYAVSDDGRVFTFRLCRGRRGGPVREAAQSTLRGGYKYVRIYQGDGNGQHYRLNRLLAELFLPPPAPGQNVVRHLDGNPANNRLDNLAWGTQAENMQDMVRHGRSLRGTRNPNAKMTDNVVRAIRLLRAEGYQLRPLAAFLGMSVEAVEIAANGRGWRHVEDAVLNAREA